MYLTLTELMAYFSNQQKNVDPQGPINSAKNITPLAELLTKNFQIRNFKNAQEIRDNILMAEKDPNLKVSLSREEYLKLTSKWSDQRIGQYTQNVLWEWLKYSFIPVDTTNISTFKNCIVYSLSDITKDGKPIQISNLSSLVSTDITKQLSSGIGFDAIDSFNIEMRNDLDSIINLIGAVGYLYVNQIYDQQTCAKFIYLIFKMLVSTDGFIEESKILKILSTISSKDAHNSERHKVNDILNKGGFRFDFTDNAGVLNSLPLCSLEETMIIVESIKGVVFNELQTYTNSPLYNNLVNFVNLSLTKVIPVNITEDIIQILNGQTLRYNISELKMIHLNALLMKDFINMKIFNNTLPFLSTIIAYTVVTSSVKQNISVLTQVKDVLPVLNNVLNTLGLGVINEAHYNIGKVDIKEVIKLDMFYKNNGAYTEAYAIINGDNSLRDPLIKQFLSLSDLFSARAIYDVLCRNYQQIGNKHSLINLEYLDTYFTSLKYPNFTSSSSDNMRNFLNIYVNYLIDEIRILENGR